MSISCQYDSDCNRSLYLCLEYMCVRKEIFPLTYIELLGFMMLFSFSGLGAAAGIGGGPLMIPVLVVVFNYEVAVAYRLIFVVMFGSMFGNYINTRNYVDKDGKSEILYEKSLISLPLMIVGAIYGLIINKMTPGIILVIGLVLFLIHNISKVNRNYNLVKDKEIQQQKGNMTEALLNEKKNIQELPPVPIPNEIFKRMVLLIVTFFSLTLLLGTRTVPSIIGIPTCSSGYWFILILFGVVGISFSYQFENYVQSQNDPSERNSITTQQKKFQQLIQSAFIAGFSGGIFGLGGAVFLVPKYIDYGLTIKQSTNTSSFNVLVTSIINVLQVILSGDVNLEQFILFFCISFFGSFIIPKKIHEYADKHNRQSLILYLLQWLLISSVIVMPINSLYNLMSGSVSSEQYFSFKSIC